MTDPTKGPWRVFEADQYMVVSPDKGMDNGFNIAFVDGRVSDDEEEIIANARLIAAAPDLLAALEEWVDVLCINGDDCPLGYHRRAKAAIAKARGTSEPITN